MEGGRRTATELAFSIFVVVTVEVEVEVISQKTSPSSLSELIFLYTVQKYDYNASIAAVAVKGAVLGAPATAETQLFLRVERQPRDRVPLALERQGSALAEEVVL